MSRGQLGLFQPQQLGCFITQLTTSPAAVVVFTILQLSVITNCNNFHSFIHLFECGDSFILLNVWLSGVLVEAVRIFVTACSLRSTGAYLFCSMWDYNSWTRDQTSFPASQGRFLNTGPPGKSLNYFYSGVYHNRLLVKERRHRESWCSEQNELLNCVLANG